VSVPDLLRGTSARVFRRALQFLKRLVQLLEGQVAAPFVWVCFEGPP
jgi:hypothetical protein